jgi:DASH complex subunit DAD3
MATASISNPSVSSDIFSVNPYDGHPQLKPVEAEVLWEYAKLAQNVKLAGLTSRRF